MTDVLTELPNRRHALRQLHRLWKEIEQSGDHLSGMVLDADGFKTINETFGHDSVDIVLKSLARELQHSVRNDDIVCRMGGDESLIICPHTPSAYCRTDQREYSQAQGPSRWWCLARQY